MEPSLRNYVILFVIVLTSVYFGNQLRKANEIIATHKWDATDFEKDYVLSILKEKDVKIDILEIDNQALRDSRDMFQNRNAELLKTISSLKRKLQV